MHKRWINNILTQDLVTEKSKEGLFLETNRLTGYPDILGAVRSKPIIVSIYQVSFTDSVKSAQKSNTFHFFEGAKVTFFLIHQIVYQKNYRNQDCRTGK